LKTLLGISITLSGGACAWAPTGAPTCWNSESMAGRSTTPSILTPAGRIPARPTITLSPGRACRFAAVCWNSTTPSPRPDSVRIAPGNARA